MICNLVVSGQLVSVLYTGIRVAYMVLVRHQTRYAIPSQEMIYLQILLKKVALCIANIFYCVPFFRNEPIQSPLFFKETFVTRYMPSKRRGLR